jgi:D-alanyl-D-alanine carboxypeptidase
MRHLIPRLILLIAICLSIPLPIYADRVDQFIRAHIKKNQIPGLSLAVIRNGKVIKARGYGFSNLELNVPATKDTVYEIGSISKQFTAMAIMLLVEDGKLSLDDKLTKYLFPLPTRWQEFTIRACLDMTTGIKGHADISDFSMLKDYSADEFIKLFENEPLAIEPGEDWYYTSTGYNLIGMVIEKVTGKSYEEFITERIFEPLKLTSTRVKNIKEIVKHRADGYTFNHKGELIKSEPHRPRVIAPSGGILSNLVDLIKLDAALNKQSFLKKESFREIWSPVRLKNGTIYPYGLGWKVEEFRKRRVVSHSGGMPGFTSMFARYVDDRLTVIILTNRYNAKAYKLAKVIANLYVPGLTPRGLRIKRDPEPNVTKGFIDILSKLAREGEADREVSHVKLYLSPDDISSIKEDIASFKALKFLEREDIAEDRLYSNHQTVRRIYRYKLISSKEPRYYTFHLDKDKKVVAIMAEEW